MEEDKKATTEETSVLPPPSEQQPATEATPAETVEKESVSVEKESNAPADSAAATTAAATAAPASSPARNSSSSRRSSGVSGIANRVHRHETRVGTEGRLPSRFSDYEVGSPRATRQRSSDIKKNAAAPKASDEASSQQEPIPGATPVVLIPPSETAAAKDATEKEVDPADELEMMLMSRGALAVEPPAKKAREDVPADSAAPAAKTASPAKKSKSKRKSLVEGREARVVKRKFSLEQEMSLPDELQKCLALLNNMFRQDECLPFYYAVDPIKLNIPDYWDVIKHPMDMTKIKETLLGGGYKDSKEFASDVHLMFQNACTYNPPNHPIHLLAERLEKNFDEQMAKIHTRRAAPSPALVSGGSSSQLKSVPSSSRLSTSGSRKSKSSRGGDESSDSSSSSSSSDSSDSESSDSSDDGHKKRKGKHHGKHHHHHHHHKKGDKARGKKRSRSSSSIASELASVQDSIRLAELEKLQNEVRLLKSQLMEQKQNKAKAASAARAEKAAMAAAKRASKSVSKRPPVSFDTAPDPDRPVTEEDKRRISGNINRLPPERMLPLVCFVQEQIPPLLLAVPGHLPMRPSEIEVDLDTLDNRTLRTVDHKVRQALALAGQARRRAERRMLEMQMHKEQQQRHHAGMAIEQQQVVAAKSSYQAQMLTPQQVSMNYMETLRRSVGMGDGSLLSPSGSRGGYGGPDNSVPGTPGSGQSGAGGDMMSHSNSDMDDDDNIDGPDEENAGTGAVPNLGSDSDSSSSSSSSSDSEGDDDIGGTFVPPPLAPGAATGPVTLSQALSSTNQPRP